MRKRITGIFLAVLMAVSLLHFPAIPTFAAGNSPEVTLPVMVGTGKVFDDLQTDLITEGSISFTDDFQNDGSKFEYAASDSGETAPEGGWSEDKPFACNVGTYYVWYRWVSETYGGIEATCLGSYEITRADYSGYETSLSVNIPVEANSTKLITLPAIPDGASCGTITNENSEAFSLSLTETGKLLLINGSSDLGTSPYTFTVAVSPDDNHNGYSISVTVTPASTAGSVAAVNGAASYASLQSAIDAAESGTAEAPAVITLLQDSAEDIEIYKSGLTIDLNGKTLTGTGSLSEKEAYNSRSTVISAVTVLPGTENVTLKNGTLSFKTESRWAIAGILLQGGTEPSSVSAESLEISVQNTRTDAGPGCGICACDASNASSVTVKKCRISASAYEAVGIAAGSYTNPGLYAPQAVTVEECSIDLSGTTYKSGGAALYTYAASNTIIGENTFDIYDGLRIYRGIDLKSSAGTVTLDLSAATGDLGSIITKYSMADSPKLCILGDINALFTDKAHSSLCPDTWLSVLPEGFALTGGGKLAYTDSKDYPYAVKSDKDRVGNYPDAADWQLETDGTLTIYAYSGKGLTALADVLSSWTDEISRIVLTGSMTSVPAGAFANLTKLKSIYIQNDNVTEIQASAFAGCTALTDICLSGADESSWTGALQGTETVSASVHTGFTEAAFLAAEAVKEIGTVSGTEDSFEKISAAQEKYAALDEAGQALLKDYLIAGSSAEEVLKNAWASYETFEASQDSFSVTLYARSVCGQTSVAKVSGGGSYHTIRGGDVTAEAVPEGYSFYGWYLTSSSGELIRQLSDCSTLHVNPGEDIILTAVYCYDVNYRSAVIVPALSSYTVSLKSVSPEPDGDPDNDPVPLVISYHVDEESYDETDFASLSDEKKKTLEKHYNFVPGTGVSIKSDSSDFLCWADEYGNILSFDQEYEFICIRCLRPTEVKLGELAMVSFFSADGALLSSGIVRATDTVSFPEAPEGYEWSMTEEAIKEAMKTEARIEVRLTKSAE